MGKICRKNASKALNYHYYVLLQILLSTVTTVLNAYFVNIYGRPLYLCPVVSFIFFLSFFTSPNLSGHRLDVYYTSTHGVALVRI